MPKKSNDTRSTYLLHTPSVHQRKIVEAAVGKLEKAGWKVYWPDRDNADTDVDGFAANLVNIAQMDEAACVHILWDGKSSGFLFGLGMAWALHKPVKVISSPDTTEWRSFQNLIERWRKEA